MSSFGNFNAHNAHNAHNIPGTDIYDVYPTRALITHRDGTVGPWQGITTIPEQLYRPSKNLDLEDTLWQWEPRVRAEIIDSQLHSGLRFSIDESLSNSAFQLDYIDLDKTQKDSPLSFSHVVTMIHPFDKNLTPDYLKPLIEKQLKFIDLYADLRLERETEILTELSMSIPYWASIVSINPHCMSKTLELIAAALRLAFFIEMRFKHALAIPRPIEFSPQVQPMIQTPGHGSLPSGHATESYIVANVLGELVEQARKESEEARIKPKQTQGTSDPLNENSEQADKKNAFKVYLEQRAARIAINRTVAGVHFPMDSSAGRLLGVTLGDFFISRATDKAHAPRTFKLEKTQWSEDFNPDEPLEDGDETPMTTSRFLKWLWDEAKKEWKQPSA